MAATTVGEDTAGDVVDAAGGFMLAPAMSPKAQHAPIACTQVVRVFVQQA